MKELIISIYDGGYEWSVAIDGKINRKSNDVSVPPSRRAEFIYHTYYENNLPKFIETFQNDFERIIVCEDVCIDIWER